MKTTLKEIIDKGHKVHLLLAALVLLIVASPAIAQDDKEATKDEPKKERAARPAFESAWWFDGQTGEVYNPKTLEFVIQHRFGLVNSGNNDLFGIYGPSNIRLGLSYVPVKNLSVGFGYTKNKMILDLNAKYRILSQTRSNSMPISLTYNVNMGLELRDKENYLNTTDRYNYFHQLIIMKRFNSKISAQIAPSFTHYNAVNWEQQDDGSYQIMENDSWGISVGARYKINANLIIMLGYDQPLTQHDINQPKPSINFGLEISTSNHAFQFFATNYNRIQPQENYMFNQNDFQEGQFLIGFNITRLRAL
jgi:opacity protein-like surface antigen